MSTEQEPAYDMRPHLISIVKLSALGYLVMLLALLTMAWQHEINAVIAIGTSLVYVQVAFGVSLYRLGKLAR